MAKEKDEKDGKFDLYKTPKSAYWYFGFLVLIVVVLTFVMIKAGKKAEAEASGM